MVPLIRRALRRSLLLAAACALSWAVASPAAAQELVCSDCHDVDPAAFEKTVHGTMGIGCTDCHTGAAVSHEDTGVPPVDCASCHQDAVDELKTSPHGQPAFTQISGKPTCQTCHGPVHQLVSHEESASKINGRHLTETCAQCHASPMIAQAYERLYGRKPVTVLNGSGVAMQSYLGERVARQIMLPRQDVVYLSTTRPVGENLRLGPRYTTIPVHEELDWSADGSFAQAVELCNGNGACRKLESGVMCPSYRATREEENSTRGRANALRLAISNRYGGGGLDDESLFDVMERRPHGIAFRVGGGILSSLPDGNEDAQSQDAGDELVAQARPLLPDAGPRRAGVTRGRARPYGARRCRAAT